jgi:hypothetical protein
MRDGLRKKRAMADIVVIDANTSRLEGSVDPRLGTGQEHKLAQDRYRAWIGGMTKSDIEQRFLGTSRAHGKRFSTMVRKHLGINTEKQHPLIVENERLRELLWSYGIDPDSAPT